MGNASTNLYYQTMNKIIPILYLSLIMIVLLLAINDKPDKPVPNLPITHTIIRQQTSQEEEIIQLVNNERVKNGLQPLVTNYLLTKATDIRNADILAFHYFGHNSPDGINYVAALQQAGYTNMHYAGENIAVGYNRNQQRLHAWMNSPEHRANILNKDYTEVGISAKEGMYLLHGKVQETTSVVMIFGNRY